MHGILQPLMLRRIKKDVELSLPPKVETKILVPLTALQKVLHAFRISLVKEAKKQGIPCQHLFLESVACRRREDAVYCWVCAEMRAHI